MSELPEIRDFGIYRPLTPQSAQEVDEGVRASLAGIETYLASQGVEARFGPRAPFATLVSRALMVEHMHTLGGLSFEYASLIQAINTRVRPKEPDELVVRVAGAGGLSGKVGRTLQLRLGVPGAQPPEVVSLITQQREVQRAFVDAGGLPPLLVHPINHLTIIRRIGQPSEWEPLDQHRPMIRDIVAQNMEGVRTVSFGHLIIGLDYNQPLPGGIWRPSV
jgi:hypothetical protein